MKRKAKNLIQIAIDEWVVVNVTDWYNGWINICLIRFCDQKKPFGKKVFRVAWNGERFAENKTFHMMMKSYPDDVERVGRGLRDVLPGPEVMDSLGGRAFETETADGDRGDADACSRAA